jgi:hypothetical protein
MKTDNRLALVLAPEPACLVVAGYSMNVPGLEELYGIRSLDKVIF